MIRLWALRLVLIALPFVVWYVWAKLRPQHSAGRAPPYPWLFLAGIALVAGSTVATVLVREDNTDAVYVPAEARPDGSISEGRFEER
jgi:hypothetical protein